MQAFELTILNWIQAHLRCGVLDAVMVPVVGQALPESPYVMEFQNTFSLVGITPGRHMLYFQAWDTDPTGAAGNAGMINAIEINVPSFTFIPLLIR